MYQREKCNVLRLRLFDGHTSMTINDLMFCLLFLVSRVFCSCEMVTMTAGSSKMCLKIVVKRSSSTSKMPLLYQWSLLRTLEEQNSSVDFELLSQPPKPQQAINFVLDLRAYHRRNRVLFKVDHSGRSLSVRSQFYFQL